MKFQLIYKKIYQIPMISLSPYRFHSQNEIITFPQQNTNFGCGGFQNLTQPKKTSGCGGFSSHKKWLWKIWNLILAVKSVRTVFWVIFRPCLIILELIDHFRTKSDHNLCSINHIWTIVRPHWTVAHHGPIIAYDHSLWFIGHPWANFRQFWDTMD